MRKAGLPDKPPLAPPWHRASPCSKAGEKVYSVSFIEHWLQRLLFYDAPSWAFVLGYSLFGLLVLVTWWYFPPRSKTRYDEGRV